MTAYIQKLAVPLAVSLAFASGCRREEVTHATQPKAQVESAAMPASTSKMPADHAQFASAAASEGAQAQAGLKWTLPAGWTESHPGGMRYATLQPKGGAVDVSVISLPGPAGGELANVNRWRGQIGLGPIEDAQLSKARQTVHAKGFDLSLFDFTGEGEKKSRMVTALATAGESTWFVKMVGDADAVGAARADFVNLLKSLHFDAAN